MIPLLYHLIDPRQRYWPTMGNELCSDFCAVNKTKSKAEKMTCEKIVADIDDCKLAVRFDIRNVVYRYDISKTLYPYSNYTNKWISRVVPKHCLLANETGKVYFNSHLMGDRHPGFFQVCRSKGM